MFPSSNVCSYSPKSTAFSVLLAYLQSWCYTCRCTCIAQEVISNNRFQQLILVLRVWVLLVLWLERNSYHIFLSPFCLVFFSNIWVAFCSLCYLLVISDWSKQMVDNGQTKICSRFFTLKIDKSSLQHLLEPLKCRIPVSILWNKQ